MTALKENIARFQTSQSADDLILILWNYNHRTTI